ncbi:MAG: hypothetical protein M5U28_33550 [Sandaracinaceae bacterium]|nr:hypothetical protein [Sandaracinaceae bacterium]
MLSDARLAAVPGDGVVVSVSLGGASAVFAPGSASERTVGDETDNRVTQALGVYDEDGGLVAARAVAVADPILEGFTATGYALDSLADGTLFTAGRFLAGARFGGTDARAVTLQTVREMPEEDVVITSEEGYVARFDPARAIEWARRARSESGLAHHAVIDLDALEDGSSILAGSFEDGAVTLGEGEPSETRFSAAGVARETFLARLDPDGALSWARRIGGQTSPRRVAALPDGSFFALVRFGSAATFGPGEALERTLPAPPTGTQESDAVARYDADGRLLWVTPLVVDDATTYPGLRDLVPQADGSLIVAGTFRGEVSWPDEAEVPPHTVYGVEGLLARLDADGRLVWQRRLRPVNTLQVHALAPAEVGGTWVAVSVSTHGATFTPEGGEPLVLAGGPVTRLVLLRYDDEGLLRTAHLVADDDAGADDVLPLASGDLVIVGRYGDGTVLEPGTGEEVALPPALAFRNLFLARYSPLP